MSSAGWGVRTSALRPSRGSRTSPTFVAMDGSNHAGVAFDVDDLDALKTLLASTPPEVAAQAEAHGVIQPMTVYVEA